MSGSRNLEAAAAARAPRDCGLEQMHIGVAGLRVFTQGADVIQRPECAPMRGNDEVVILHHQVVDRHSRQVKLQRLPVLAVVKRNINSAFGAGKQKFGILRILAYRMYEIVAANPIGDWLPRLAKIRGLEDVRLEVILAVIIDGNVRGSRGLP